MGREHEPREEDDQRCEEERIHDAEQARAEEAAERDADNARGEEWEWEQDNANAPWGPQ